VDPSATAKDAGEGKGYGGWGEHKFSKNTPASRWLYVTTNGDLSDYDYDKEIPKPRKYVQFLNDNLNVLQCAQRARAAEKSVRGSGNEGSSGAFLYKRVAVLVPLIPNAEASLSAFSAKHAGREHPSFLP